MSGIADSKLVQKWISGAVTAVFSFLSGIADSKLVTKWIPGAVNAAASFLDRLPESKLFSRGIPDFLTAIGRVLDELLDHILLLGRELFLVNRQELRRSGGGSVITRMAAALAEKLHRAGLIPRRWLRGQSPDEVRYGSYVTNAISFGLLLGALGLVAAIVYVFFRMGAK